MFLSFRDIGSYMLVIVFATILHGLTPRLGVYFMNVNVPPLMSQQMLTLCPDIDPLQNNHPHVYRSHW